MNTIIFGASGNLGSGICRSLLERGDTVVGITARLESATLLESDLQEYESFKTYHCNLLKKDELDVLIGILLSKQVNNLIFLTRGEVALDSESSGLQFQREAIEDYLLSFLVPLQITLQISRIENSGLDSVVFASSQYGLVAQSADLYENPMSAISTPYCSTRGAINSGVRSLAAQLGKQGIRVNAIALGGYEGNTELELSQKISERIPSGRMLTSSEVAGPFEFLTSKNSEGITGAILTVDKGWTIT